MLDRSPDEMGSHDNDLDDLDSDDDLEDGINLSTDGERIIYPWMKKIHVAGVGEFNMNLHFPSIFPPIEPTKTFRLLSFTCCTMAPFCSFVLFASSQPRAFSFPFYFCLAHHHVIGQTKYFWVENVRIFSVLWNAGVLLFLIFRQIFEWPLERRQLIVLMYMCYVLCGVGNRRGSVHCIFKFRSGHCVKREMYSRKIQIATNQSIQQF